MRPSFLMRIKLSTVVPPHAKLYVDQFPFAVSPPSDGIIFIPPLLVFL